jgi:ribonuclease Z
MPSHVLAREGQGATLLIHEATMADDQVEMARAKGHSTFGQAVGIGRRYVLQRPLLDVPDFLWSSMNAEKVLLTHFSARYPKLPPSAKQRSVSSQDGRGRRDPVLALAFDQARIRIGDMWKLNHYLPAIEQSFLDTREEDDDEDTSSAIEVDVA